MEDIPVGRGMEEMETGRTQKDRITGAVQDVVSGEAETLEGGGRMGITKEEEVSEGEVVTTPPPHPPPIRTETAGRQSELLGRRQVGVRSDLLEGWVNQVM